MLDTIDDELRPLPARTPVCVVLDKAYVPGWVGPERTAQLSEALQSGAAEIVQAHDASGIDIGLYIVMKESDDDSGS